VRYYIPLMIWAAIYSSCTSPDTKPVAAADSSAAVSGMLEETAKATYKGDFDGSPIFITINYTSSSHIAGYNEHKGLRRNLSGKLQQEEDGWAVQLNEPGDHPYDGRFHLVFDKHFTTAHGRWTPLNTPSLREKQLILTRQTSSKNYWNPGDFRNRPLSGTRCDITFNDDGSCILNYYEKINNSTYALQMNTVRGTWENKDYEIRVNWQPNEQFGKRNSTFKLSCQATLNSIRCDRIIGEGFEFSLVQEA